MRSFSDHPDFFIQDPNTLSGIFVYTPTGFEVLSIGDEVNLKAQVSDFYGVTQLSNVESYSILSSGNDVSYFNIGTGDIGVSCNFSGELFEGMLVQISDFMIESVDTQYNSIYINDGSGTAKLDDYIFNNENLSFSELISDYNDGM